MKPMLAMMILGAALLAPTSAMAEGAACGMGGLEDVAVVAGDAFWNFNPARLVVNDAIHACVAKDRLRLTRPDGKDCSAKIVRAMREGQASSPQKWR